MQITLEPKVEKALKRIAGEVARSPTKQANLVLAAWADKYLAAGQPKRKPDPVPARHVLK